MAQIKLNDMAKWFNLISAVCLFVLSVIMLIRWVSHVFTLRGLLIPLQSALIAALMIAIDLKQKKVMEYFKFLVSYWGRCAVLMFYIILYFDTWVVTIIVEIVMILGFTLSLIIACKGKTTEQIEQSQPIIDVL